MNKFLQQLASDSDHFSDNEEANCSMPTPVKRIASGTLSPVQGKPSSSLLPRPLQPSGSTASRTRFPTRSPWDLWHRWCTPWIAQPESQREASHEESVSTAPIDHITGNITFPYKTSGAEATTWRQVPGTYPHAPGVQHRIAKGASDPRWLATFARRVCAVAETVWEKQPGLARAPDGTIGEDVLVARRAQAPVTLSGIWPGAGTSGCQCFGTRRAGDKY